MKQSKISKTIGSRQIHLDFHTSDHLKDIGKSFSKLKFQEALKVAHVDSINLFAKCHHSWCYYPTKNWANASTFGFRFIRGTDQCMS